MEFTLANLGGFNMGWDKSYWITICCIEYKTQTRSLLHLEYCGGLWKVQFLFLANNCWLFGDES
jgi:hypothetical protein